MNKIKPNIQCPHKNSTLDISSKKNEIQKNLVLYSTLDELFNDTTHISLRWIYRSAKIVWIKKPIWVYSSSPRENVVKCYILFCLSKVLLKGRIRKKLQTVCKKNKKRMHYVIFCCMHKQCITGWKNNSTLHLHMKLEFFCTS